MKTNNNIKCERVKVFLRVRPFTNDEMNQNPNTSIESLDTKSNTVVIKKDFDNKTFTYDGIFTQSSSQNDIFDTTSQEVIDSVLDGYNGTIFAYGQTGSGKTYTMVGDYNNILFKGIIPRSIDYIFDSISNSNAQYEICVSFIQIYLESMQDLLETSNKDIRVREDKEKGVYLDGVKWVKVKSSEDCGEVFSLGEKNRVTESTRMNAHSSRSHAVFIVRVERTKNSQHTVSYLYLVDLAGSERGRKTLSHGLRLDEAKKINYSLLVLGNCIQSLTDPKCNHVSYRDSKLTRLLQESLGGNAKTSLIVTISPSEYNTDETLSTLNFASRAMKVKNKPVINESIDYRALSQKLQEDLDKMSDENAMLRIQIENLKKAQVKVSDKDKEEVEKKYDAYEMIIHEVDKILFQKEEEIDKLKNDIDELMKENRELNEMLADIKKDKGDLEITVMQLTSRENETNYNSIIKNNHKKDYKIEKTEDDDNEDYFLIISKIKCDVRDKCNGIKKEINDTTQKKNAIVIKSTQNDIKIKLSQDLEEKYSLNKVNAGLKIEKNYLEKQLEVKEKQIDSLATFAESIEPKAYSMRTKTELISSIINLKMQNILFAEENVEFWEYITQLSKKEEKLAGIILGIQKDLSKVLSNISYIASKYKSSISSIDTLLQKIGKSKDNLSLFKSYITQLEQISNRALEINYTSETDVQNIETIEVSKISNSTKTAFSSVNEVLIGLIYNFIEIISLLKTSYNSDNEKLQNSQIEKLNNIIESQNKTISTMNKDKTLINKNVIAINSLLDIGGECNSEFNIDLISNAIESLKAQKEELNTRLKITENDVKEEKSKLQHRESKTNLKDLGTGKFIFQQYHKAVQKFSEALISYANTKELNE